MVHGLILLASVSLRILRYFHILHEGSHRNRHLVVPQFSPDSRVSKFSAHHIDCWKSQNTTLINKIIKRK